MFNLGSGTRSTLANNKGRVQNGTRQQKNKRPNPVVHRILPPKTEPIITQKFFMIFIQPNIIVN